jgi:hypothetical protein
MKRYLLFLTAAILCITSNAQNCKWVNKGVKTASAQLLSTASEITDTKQMPRTIYANYDTMMVARQVEREANTLKLKKMVPQEKVGQLSLCDIYDWTSGFFPGSLWYLYEMTDDAKALSQAKHYTNLLNPLRHFTGTHDLGFMVGCSFGNALRLAPADTVKDIIVETAGNLSKRFNSKIGCIRSWDFGVWNFPVIIDNMMNLELLYTAQRLTGDSKYGKIAMTHANTTMKNHFRPDFTSWHVVSYNNDGTIQKKQTWQGKSDNSAWARGQAWGLYGYTQCFMETGDSTYLTQACHIADMIMKKVTSKDAVPYWDYNAPVIKETPRDASAGAITASAMLDLSKCVSNGGEKYFKYGEKILKSLSGPKYLAKPGTNCGFILKHSTGSLPNGSEIDVPLNYADYYYLEGLVKYMKIKGIKYEK